MSISSWVGDRKKDLGKNLRIQIYWLLIDSVPTEQSLRQAYEATKQQDIWELEIPPSPVRPVRPVRNLKEMVRALT